MAEGSGWLGDGASENSDVAEEDLADIKSLLASLKMGRYSDISLHPSL